jgi:DNA-3-methyladenine glycosylase II
MKPTLCTVTSRQVRSHFRKSDRRMFEVIDRVGPIQLKLERDGFKMLVRSILSQQISTSAARSIRLRLENLVGAKGMRPEAIGYLSLEQLRECGISRQKGSYLLDLAEKCANRSVRLSRLSRLDDDDVIEELIQVKGIGRWTAQMYLMFSLGRLDVFPHDDLGVRMAIRGLHGFEEVPTKGECLEIGERWKPFASVGSWYCWRYLEIISQQSKQKAAARKA